MSPTDKGESKLAFMHAYIFFSGKVIQTQAREDDDDVSANV